MTAAPLRPSTLAAALAGLVAAGCATPGRTPVDDGHFASLPALGGVQAALLYHQREGTPAPEADLVEAWGETCGDRDPVAKEVAERGARAALAQAREELAGSRRWMLPLRQTLGGYDRQRGGFPTTVRTGAVVKFDRIGFCRPDVAYAVAFLNGDDFAILKVPEAEAVELVRASPSREVLHELEVEVVGARPGPPAAVVVVRILRMRTRDLARRTVLADVGAGR
jgi:hypothetical protein